MSTSYDIRATTYCMLVPIVVISIVYISEKCSNSQIKKLSNKTSLLYSSPIIVHGSLSFRPITLRPVHFVPRSFCPVHFVPFQFVLNSFRPLSFSPEITLFHDQFAHTFCPLSLRS
jgi:hypothetical protein